MRLLNVLDTSMLKRPLTKFGRFGISFGKSNCQIYNIMGRIRGLELLFNLVWKQLKSKADCLVAALHCLLINEGLQCMGIGEDWPEDDSSTGTELLPKDWNENQELYSLRYATKDFKHRYLFKLVKAGHTLHVNVALDKNTVAVLSLSIESHVSDDYKEYSDAYRDLDSLSDSFRKDVLQKLQVKETKAGTSGNTSAEKKKVPREGPISPLPPPRPQPDFSTISSEDFYGPHAGMLPDIGGSDLNPFHRGRPSGMLVDPSSFGIPSRPTLPQFGVGSPGGLPRGAVPPGARFDPFRPPIRGPNRFNPDPDHFRPPDFDDII
ncbi:proteasome inhibitor PI31 subunit-like isoform X2 [Stegodyphus dumicola]|uniref:proteasome inhibitor PI31 subunit-like isoform X2 n=1 Tax=Stegodyphus dumicola TaxID=202533 RepID=UPI0015A84FB3|nr:proteasome inhibitor PI31 subunit-like isoform X2 [Stegodyphus dumicola]